MPVGTLHLNRTIKLSRAISWPTLEFHHCRVPQRKWTTARALLRLFLTNRFEIPKQSPGTWVYKETGYGIFRLKLTTLDLIRRIFSAKLTEILLSHNWYQTYSRSAAIRKMNSAVMPVSSPTRICGLDRN